MLNIVGYGYVGSAFGYLCGKNKVQFTITDNVHKEEPDAIRVFKEIGETIKYAEAHDDINFYVICVPTPSEKDGKCDTSIVEGVVKKLIELSTKETYIIIKSTVCPGTCRRLRAIGNCEIVFCPEFLTEKEYKSDMYNAKFIMLGFHDDASLAGMDKVIGMMRDVYKHNSGIKVISQIYEACEIFKYTINVFLGLKVWFFNEVYETCEKFDIQYDIVREMLALDPRIGMSHTQIPGNHGFGFGGACLPKEMRAFKELQADLGIPNKILENVLERNEEMRKKKTD